MSVPDRCFYPAQLLIPADDNLFDEWACVACDQFTSQPEYWREVAQLVGDKPSTLHLMLPECYLSQADERVAAIHQAMRDVQPVLAPAVQQGFVLVERNTPGGARLGLVGVVDLEHYNYHKGAKSLIRATEGTIESRIPPRKAVRQGAALELSHVLMLMDDPMHSVIEPLFARRNAFRKVYDFPLMMGGGHLVGYAVETPAEIAAVYEALDRLRARLNPADPLLFAVGDGNHSLATAKACWEEIKPTLTADETAVHPARFAMVELENIHDDALHFEPIHRVLFGADGDDLLAEFTAFLTHKGAALTTAPDAQPITCVYEGKQAQLHVSHSPYTLAVGTLQAFLDEWLPLHPAARVDYVHGEAAVRALVSGEGAVGFLLPDPDKSALFPSVQKEGALPRKTFSMGNAEEKRYYMECRKL